MKIKIDDTEAIYIESHEAFKQFEKAHENQFRYIYERPHFFPCLAIEAGQHESFWDSRTWLHFAYIYNFTFTDHDA